VIKETQPRCINEINEEYENWRKFEANYECIIKLEGKSQRKTNMTTNRGPNMMGKNVVLLQTIQNKVKDQNKISILTQYLPPTGTL
jgi:hypothetical protein